MKSYAQILRVPGGASASAAAFVARLPLSMGALGIVLLVSDRTGSYSAAGVVAAYYIVAAAVSGPLQGRLGDRIGQRAVLIVAATLLTVGMVAFVSVVEAGEPRWVLSATAAVAGTGAPQAGSFIRTRWTHLLRDRPRELQTAFALEAVVDEVVFVSGPILVAAIATAIDPTVGLYTTAALSFVGSLTLASLGATEPPRSRGQVGPRPPLSLWFITSIVLVSICLGTLFGATEVIVVAFTDEREARHLAGLVLAAWAFGSLVAGLVVGTRPAPASQFRRLQVTALALGLTFAPLIVIDSVLILGVAMIFGGTMIAPALIAHMTLVEQHVPRSRLTEGIAFAATGVAAGVAPGAAVAGQVVDAWGASAAFAVPLVAGILASLLAASILPRSAVRSRTPAAEPRDPR